MGAAKASDGLAGLEFFAGFFLVVGVELVEIAFDEWGFDGAGADGVDAQGFGVVDGELAGHGDDGALACAVGEALFDADEAGYGGDVDDGACCGVVLLLGGQEEGQEGAGDEVDGADIDVEEAVKVFGLGGLDGANVAYAGVVDEDVEAGELGFSGGDGLRAGDVEVEGVGVGNFGGEGIGGFLIEVGDIDFGSGAGEFFDGGCADAAGAAGDQGAAVVEAEVAFGGCGGGFCHGSAQCNCFGTGSISFGALAPQSVERAGDRAIGILDFPPIRKVREWMGQGEFWVSGRGSFFRGNRR